MDPVEEQPALPRTVRPGPNRDFLLALLQTLTPIFQRLAFRVNRLLPKDGTEAMSGPLTLASYTTAGRPTASSYTGAIIYVSDASAGSKFQGSDGSSWVSLG